MGKKMSDPKLDALFEKMSRECANSMTGTHPTKNKTKGKSKVSKKVRNK